MLERNPIWEEPWWRSISQNGRFGDLSDDNTTCEKTQTKANYNPQLEIELEG
jgi:hypothetical protein